MPAWIYVIVAAAVAFVAWYGFARRWWHSLRYSWRGARHLADLTQTELIPGAEFLGSMLLEDDLLPLPAPPVDPEPWRQQMARELSPEALDPGPGGGLVSSSPPSGPDQRELCAHCGRPALGYARGAKGERLCHHDERSCYHRVTVWNDPPTRLADTGDITAAHEAHPEPFDLMGAIRAAEEAGGGIVAIPPGTYGPFFHTSAEGQAAWLGAQMGVLFGWVRVMVPQVTGWSVSA